MGRERTVRGRHGREYTRRSAHGRTGVERLTGDEDQEDDEDEESTTQEHEHGVHCASLCRKRTA